MSEESIIAKVINLVTSADRRMPAHFTGNGTRTQTFLVDFDGISEEDDYEMASQVYYNQPDISPEIDRHCCLKIGEDVMVACFIVAKLGQKEKIEYLKNEIVQFNISLFPEDMHKNLQRVIQKEEVKEYFDFCEKFGIERAGV